MSIEIELPKAIGQVTVGEVREFLNQPGTLSGHILMDIVPVAIAGHCITENMIGSLHAMLGTEPPKFLKGDQVVFSMRFI